MGHTEGGYEDSDQNQEQKDNLGYKGGEWDQQEKILLKLNHLIFNFKPYSDMKHFNLHTSSCLWVMKMMAMTAAQTRMDHNRLRSSKD